MLKTYCRSPPWGSDVEAATSWEHCPFSQRPGILQSLAELPLLAKKMSLGEQGMGEAWVNYWLTGVERTGRQDLCESAMWICLNKILFSEIRVSWVLLTHTWLVMNHKCLWQVDTFVALLISNKCFCVFPFNLLLTIGLSTSCLHWRIFYSLSL
jgi:hypothetical protein